MQLYIPACTQVTNVVLWSAFRDYSMTNMTEVFVVLGLENHIFSGFNLQSGIISNLLHHGTVFLILKSDFILIKLKLVSVMSGSWNLGIVTVLMSCGVTLVSCVWHVHSIFKYNKQCQENNWKPCCRETLFIFLALEFLAISKTVTWLDQSSCARSLFLTVIQIVWGISRRNSFLQLAWNISFWIFKRFSNI